MFLDAWIMLIHAEESDVAAEFFLHSIDQIVISIEDCVTVRENSFGYDGFHSRHLLDRVNASESHVIGSHVGDDSYITILKGETDLENSPSCTFVHGEVDRWILQYECSTDRPRTIASHHKLILYVNSVACRVSHLFSRTLCDVSGEPRGRCFSVCAGDGNNGNAAGASFRKQHVHHRLCHISRPSFRRIDVHAKAGSSID